MSSTQQQKEKSNNNAKKFLAGLSLPAILAVTAAGAQEGFGFYTSGLINPDAVHSQMQFKSMAMMKLFASAVGASAITQSIYASMYPEQFEASRQGPAVPMSKTVIYSLMMGFGLGMASSGPSLIPTQMVTISNGYILVAGALVGCAAHAILEKLNQVTVCPAMVDQKKYLLDKKFGVSYPKMAFGVGAALVGAAFGMEAFYPTSHARDLTSLYGPNGADLFKFTLYPAIGGIFIGLNQIPLRIVGNDGAGASSCMMSIVNALSFGTLAERFKFGENVAATSQFFYMFLGTAGGALLMKSYNPAPCENQALVSPWKSFVGTAMCLFASRMNQSCICGGPISESSEMNVRGFVAAACVFAGGILAAQFF